MATKLILIRHGETDWNVEQRYCGFMDIGLNATGKKQVRKLRDRLKGAGVHVVYASDRKRALESARIIFDHGRKINSIPELREIHFGIFEGLTYKEILKKYPEIYKKWLNDPYRTAIPKGEELDVFQKRVIGAIRNIVSLHKNKTIAIVCHGGSISVIINHLLRKKKFWEKIPGSASLSIIEYDKGKAKIEILNDTTHLSMNPEQVPA